MQTQTGGLQDRAPSRGLGMGKGGKGLCPPRAPRSAKHALGVWRPIISAWKAVEDLSEQRASAAVPVASGLTQQHGQCLHSVLAAAAAFELDDHRLQRQPGAEPLDQQGGRQRCHVIALATAQHVELPRRRRLKAGQASLEINWGSGSHLVPVDAHECDIINGLVASKDHHGRTKAEHAMRVESAVGRRRPLDLSLVETDRPVMCGRYASTMPPELMASTFAAIVGATNLQPTWNMAPTQAGAVVRRHPQSGDRQIDSLQWGLIPNWTKDLKAARRPINARAETVATSGMFRDAFTSRRCLVPADLFYEWKAMPDGKQPYAIARTDGAPVVFGGLWEGWRGPDGEVLRTYAIVTTPANAEMAVLHERMPLVLEPAAWPGWLGEIDTDPVEMLQPAPDGTLHLWAVSRAVNAVRNNGPELIDQVDDPAAPPESGAPAGLNPA